MGSNSNSINKNDKLLYDDFRDYLENNPFIMIIGKYDHILGPRAIFSPVEVRDELFIKNLLRDALNTKNKFVILNYSRFYSQICKIEIRDENARGNKQLYAIIILRHVEYPLIPTKHLKKIEILFRQLGGEKILRDESIIFEKFFNEIQQIYLDKNEIVPLESLNLKIRAGINTIQGFCELLLEENENNKNLSKYQVQNYVEMMLDSCSDIIKSLEKDINRSLGA